MVLQAIEQDRTELQRTAFERRLAIVLRYTVVETTDLQYVMKQ